MNEAKNLSQAVLFPLTGKKKEGAFNITID